MPEKRTRIIPGDYTEQTPWVMVSLCIPNTTQWRGVVSGQIYELTRGRAWDKNTGTIKIAQEIAERIYDTMAIDCNNNWDRIAVALEGVNGKIPNLITLQEFLDDMATSPILATLAEWVDLTTVMGAILPNIDLRLTPIEWIKFLFDLRWKRQIASTAKGIENWLRLQTLADGGTTVAEGVEAVDAWFDNIGDWASILVQGGSMFAEAAQAYAQLSGLFEEGGQYANPDTALMAQRFSAALAGGALKIESDCCDLMQGSGIGNFAGTQTITPGAGGPGGGPIIDAQPSTATPVDQDKCNYSAYIVEKYLDYLAQSASAFTDIGSSARVFAVWINSIPLVFSSLAVASSVLVLFGYCIGLIIAGIPLTLALTSLKANLEETKNQLICDIHDLATTPAQARSLIEAWITAGLPVSLPSSWVSYHAEHLFTNTVLNQIFDCTWNIGDFTHDCGVCSEGGCSGPVVDYPALNTGEYTFTDNETSLDITTTSRVTVAKGNFSVRLLDDPNLCTRKLVNISITGGGTGDGYIGIYDTNTVAFDAGLGNIDKNTLSAWNSWLATNKPDVHIMAGAYWNDLGTYTFTFD